MNALFKRFWNLLLIRWGLWITVALVGSYTLFCAYVNWSGPRHWAAVKARLESEGETLDFSKLLPPRVDPATNFCAIEALDGIALEGDEHSPQGRKRKALEELGWGKNALDAPLLGSSLGFGEKTDFAAWAKFARDTAFIQMSPDSGNAARDLLQAIDQSQPLVKVLANAAITRPTAAFTPLLADRKLTSPLVQRPILQHPIKGQWALKLRALAANECGDNAAAAASVQAMLRLTDAFSLEPGLTGMLASLMSLAVTEEVIGSILEKRSATESELQSLQEAIERLKLDRRALAAVRRNLALTIDWMTCQQMNSGGGAFAELVKAEVWLEPAPWSIKLLSHLLPGGTVDENKAVIASLQFEGFIQPLKAGGFGHFILCESKMNEQLKAGGGMLCPANFIASRRLPLISGIIDRLYAGEAVRRQAIIACALERYYLQHHAYPAALTELRPQFIAAVPNDPMDDKPMRYRQTGDGRYMIWSVGFDQKDDNGKVNIDPDDKSSVRKLYKRGYKGDWSWQYQPIK